MTTMILPIMTWFSTIIATMKIPAAMITPLMIITKLIQWSWRQRGSSDDSSRRHYRTRKNKAWKCIVVKFECIGFSLNKLVQLWRWNWKMAMDFVSKRDNVQKKRCLDLFLNPKDEKETKLDCKTSECKTTRRGFLKW